MGIAEGFKLAIGIQEYDFFAKPGNNEDIDIIVARENGFPGKLVFFAGEV